MKDSNKISNRDSIKILSKKLLNIYTESNLNKITSTIIQHYKAKEFDIFKYITNALSKHISFGIDQDNFTINKYFTKLVILYHPDKITSYLKVINKALEQNNIDDLEKLNHIFIITNILNDYKNILTSTDSFSSYEPDPSLSPDMNDYVFDFKYDTEDLKEYHYDNLDSLIDDFNNIDDKSFNNIYYDLKIKGDHKVVLTSVGMKNLNGIEFFKDISYLDLKSNKISDISNLWYLEKLEELHLSDNKIFGIFGLSNLKNLRILDLSNNNIDDISDLTYLNKLEYLNLANNPLHQDQIDWLCTFVKKVVF
ncbi:MAG: hypothetical protein GQ534_01820 [Candidatus Delongbacteria bacterium]|nr:hypothetical protein [Candidatus Delongbacteria bacterium]